MKKNVKSSCCSFLKPGWVNVVVWLVVLALPIFKERIPLPDGSIVIERMAPLAMVWGYLRLGDLNSLMLMLGFCLLIYLIVAVLVKVVMVISARMGKKSMLIDR